MTAETTTQTRTEQAGTDYAIEVWPNGNAHRDFLIRIETPEFTSVCPKTGLPDFGTILVEYVPDTNCIELKAFKYYLLGYRNRGIFYENAVNQILDDILAVCQPRYIKITGSFTPRGGISTEVVLTHHQEGFDTKRLAGLFE
ncbi:MAG: preQ(1) synthase [Cyanobacteria bacterium]|nr:preQ(1) synthase [Cyanobacteriota bacterium]